MPAAKKQKTESSGGSSFKVTLDTELLEKSDFENWDFRVSACVRRHGLIDVFEKRVKGHKAAVPADKEDKYLGIEEAVVGSCKGTAGQMLLNNKITELHAVVAFFRKKWGHGEDIDEQNALEEFEAAKWDISTCFEKFLSAQQGLLAKAPGLVPEGKPFDTKMKLMLCKVAPPDLRSTASECRSKPHVSWEEVADRYRDWVKTHGKDNKEVQGHVFNTTTEQEGATSSRSDTPPQEDAIAVLTKALQEQQKQNSQILSFLTKGSKGQQKGGAWGKGKGKGVQCRICRKKFGDQSGWGHTAANCWHNPNKNNGKDGGGNNSVRKNNEKFNKKGGGKDRKQR